MYLDKSRGVRLLVKEKAYNIVLFAVLLIAFFSARVTKAYGYSGVSESGSQAAVDIESGGVFDEVESDAASDIGENNRNNIIAFENDRVEEGVPLKVSGAPQGSAYHWTIIGADGRMGTFTTTVNYYIPTEADKEKLITVTVDGMEGAQAVIYYSSLPVIYINSITDYNGIREDYTGAAMELQGNDTFRDKDEYYSGYISLKLRGNSTKWRDKRPFDIKLDKKADLLGMGENKRWALLANDIDHTLMRNKLLYDFSGAIGMNTYMKSENVVLIYNNQYYGVYQLCELVNIGPERVAVYDWEKSAEDAAAAITNQLQKEGVIFRDNAATAQNKLEDAMRSNLGWITKPYIFTYDANQDGVPETYTITDYIDLPHTTGGVLMEMDFFAFDGRNPSTMITDYSQPIYFKSPEYAITNLGLFDYTQNYIQSFEHALHSTDFFYHEKDMKYQADNRAGGYKNPGYTESNFSAPEYDGMHYSQLFDMDSLVQNFLVCELSMNWDGMKNSVFMYKDIDGLFHMGPAWDFDWAWGNINMFNTNTWYPTSWHTTEKAFTVEQYYQTVQWNRELIRDPYFLTRVYEKYHEIRSSVIEDMVKDGGTIDTYKQEYEAAAAANDAKWGYTYTEYNSVGFEESLANMKNFIKIRLAWLDDQFSSLDTLIASLGYYKPSSGLTVAGIDTKKVKGYTVITAEVTDSDIACVTFQVNGTHQYTAKVRDGRAECRIPDDALADGKKEWNVVQILAQNSSGEYIIASETNGNDENVKSNYAVFDKKDGYTAAENKASEEAAGQSADVSETPSDTSAAQVMAQSRGNVRNKVISNEIIAFLLIVTFGILTGLLVTLIGKRKKKEKE